MVHSGLLVGDDVVVDWVRACEPRAAAQVHIVPASLLRKSKRSRSMTARGRSKPLGSASLRDPQQPVPSKAWTRRLAAVSFATVGLEREECPE